MTSSDTGPPTVGIRVARAAATAAITTSSQPCLVLNAIRTILTTTRPTTRWTSAGTIPLVGMDAGLADDRCPLVDLRLEQSAERFRRRLGNRHGLGAELGETRTEGGRPHRGLQRADQFLLHRLRDALGRVEAVPHHQLEALQSLLVQRRH